MRTSLRFLLLSVFVPAAVWGACSSTCQPDGTQASGAKYRICMPERSCWNGGLVLWAHGYVEASQPVQIPEDQMRLGDGTPLATIVNALGYGFAATSYSTNGLAVLQGVEDLRDLVNIFHSKVGSTNAVYLTGASEGGLITTLSVEKYPNIYRGGVSGCGPTGDFRAQINYIGDFRVVFDYFFPGVLPGSPATVPAELMTNWQTVYIPKITAAIQASPGKLQQLLKVTGAAYDQNIPTSPVATTIDVLWYSTFATNDAKLRLGGQPFDNRSRWYSGSLNDLDLNIKAQRFAADPQALITMGQYQTTGKLTVPLVTLHTTLDPIIPQWNQTLYGLKNFFTGTGKYLTNLPVSRYGHCNFEASDVLFSFLILLLQDAGRQPSVNLTDALPASQRASFLERARAAGALR